MFALCPTNAQDISSQSVQEAEIHRFKLPLAMVNASQERVRVRRAYPSISASACVDHWGRFFPRQSNSGQTRSIRVDASAERDCKEI